MNRLTLLPAAWLVDQLAGDPEWLPHPVRLIGRAILAGESMIRRPHQSKLFQLLSGGALTVVLVGSTYYATAGILRIAQSRSVLLGNCAEALLGWTCLASKNLQQEALSVVSALHRDDLPRARLRLARIVGRDTHQLLEHEICRGLIETLAESAADGIVAPTFYMVLGGVPLAMAYKAISTLDSMIGHADEEYFYFGKAAARLDDLANYLPARLTAAGIAIASMLIARVDGYTSWKTWRRDGSKHKSPNAGQPESAMAGALQVQLGGDNTYDGVRVAAPLMGGDFPLATKRACVAAMHIVSRVSFVSVIAACGVLIVSSQKFSGRLQR